LKVTLFFEIRFSGEGQGISQKSDRIIAKILFFNAKLGKKICKHFCNARRYMGMG
jgi:hypothetical protein